MAIQNRNYFFTPTVNNERFLSQDEPTEQVMRDFAASVPFKLEVSDTATETQQGLVETATQTEFDNGIDNNANGFALYARPSMIKAAINLLFNFLQPQIDQNTADIAAAQTDIINIQGDIVNIQNQFGEDMPLGSMLLYPVAAAPNAKWMLCEGQSLAIATYPDLFALVGFTFGGAGPNFLLPGLRRKFIAGYDATGGAEYNIVGASGGADSVTLTSGQSGLVGHNHVVNETPEGSHSHSVTINKRTDNVAGSNIYSLVDEPKSNNDGVITITGVADGEGRVVSTAPDHVHNVSLDPVASADAVDAHENRPAFLAFPHIIKVLS